MVAFVGTIPAIIFISRMKYQIAEMIVNDSILKDYCVMKPLRL